jgi:hypothetical protein
VTTHDHNVKSIFSNDGKSLKKKRCQRGNQKPLVEDGQIQYQNEKDGQIIQYQPEALKTDNTIPTRGSQDR